MTADSHRQLQKEYNMEFDLKESQFLADATSGKNCLLTGMAGTGKTTLIKQFIAKAPKRISITAPHRCGGAECGGHDGCTGFCGMLLGPKAGESNATYLRLWPRTSVVAFWRV